MSDLAPLAFDLETTGFEPGAAITVVGLATEVGAWQGLNTGGRHADADGLRDTLCDRSSTPVTVVVHGSEPALLDALTAYATDHLAEDRRYVCAFNGETWRSGFDLPVLRTACARADVDWPFTGFAYADVRSMVQRFNTGDVGDLAGVYETLVGGDAGDPFADSAAAVEAHATGDWAPLLAHNLADLERTLALAQLAGRFVAKSDFRMKNLTPPDG